ncbi:MAG: uracil-DNA glycosylase [Planctomycetes bacterium]|nr:uracil-DNA glycosylase [Planctomycetota bacterium]
MSEDTTSPTRLRKAVRQKLESLARSGVTHVPAPKLLKAARVSEPVSAARAKSQPAQIGGATRQFPGAAQDLPQAPAAQIPAAGTGADSLEIIASEVAGCTLCKELADTRNRTVPGVGNPRPRLMFLGEAPGADEDRQGEPFVGRAGQLLTQMIENGMGIKRKDVFIGNILKCRPPGNRTPTPEEAANCRCFLDRQLAILKPEFICCLGAVAAQNLLASDKAIGKLRGQLHNYRGMTVVCTYHPAYLLRTPAAKKDTWADLQVLMKAMGLPLPTST